MSFALAGLPYGVTQAIAGRSLRRTGESALLWERDDASGTSVRRGFVGLIDDIKTVAKTAQDMGNIDTYTKLLDVQRDALDLMEENQQLRARVHALEEQIAHRDELEFRNGRYYYKSALDLGPVCPKCYKDSGIVCKLSNSTLGPFCAHCQSSYPE